MSINTFPEVPAVEKLNDQTIYDPNRLLDALIQKLHVKSDAALSHLLEVDPPIISNIRTRRRPIGAVLLIRMHEVSDLTIGELRTLMGDRRKKFRMGMKYIKPEG
jgi:hypothetical protein